MAIKPKFNQKSVDEKISSIKALSLRERQPIVNEIKVDLRGWLSKTFEFTRDQEVCMRMWPQSLREETGFGSEQRFCMTNGNLR